MFKRPHKTQRSPLFIRVVALLVALVGAAMALGAQVASGPPDGTRLTLDEVLRMDPEHAWFNIYSPLTLTDIAIPCATQRSAATDSDRHFSFGTSPLAPTAKLTIVSTIRLPCSDTPNTYHNINGALTAREGSKVTLFVDAFPHPTGGAGMVNAAGIMGAAALFLGLGVAIGQSASRRKIALGLVAVGTLLLPAAALRSAGSDWLTTHQAQSDWEAARAVPSNQVAWAKAGTDHSYGRRKGFKVHNDEFIAAYFPPEVSEPSEPSASGQTARWTKQTLFITPQYEGMPSFRLLPANKNSSGTGPKLLCSHFTLVYAGQWLLWLGLIGLAGATSFFLGRFALRLVLHSDANTRETPTPHVSTTSAHDSVTFEAGQLSSFTAGAAFVPPESIPQGFVYPAQSWDEHARTAQPGDAPNPTTVPPVASVAASFAPTASVPGRNEPWVNNSLRGAGQKRLNGITLFSLISGLILLCVCVGIIFKARVSRSAADDPPSPVIPAPSSEQASSPQAAASQPAASQPATPAQTEALHPAAPAQTAASQPAPSAPTHVDPTVKNPAPAPKQTAVPPHTPLRDPFAAKEKPSVATPPPSAVPPPTPVPSAGTPDNGLPVKASTASVSAALRQAGGVARNCSKLRMEPPPRAALQVAVKVRFAPDGKVTQVTATAPAISKVVSECVRTAYRSARAEAAQQETNASTTLVLK